ncbi:MAG: hypothetical protein QOJ42_2782, partial [Acidobacteriaceae bacterium]|nr:hypothetical protein [Acidobacteriaceae bacterium]
PLGLRVKRRAQAEDLRLYRAAYMTPAASGLRHLAIEATPQVDQD